MIHRPTPDAPLFHTPKLGVTVAQLREALTDAPGKARADHGETAKDAARRIAPAAGRLKALVFQAILKASPYGIIDEAGIIITGLSPSTYRPRRIELVESGVVIDSGRTQATASGRQAVLWVTKEAP